MVLCVSKVAVKGKLCQADIKSIDSPKDGYSMMGLVDRWRLQFKQNWIVGRISTEAGAFDRVGGKDDALKVGGGG